MIFVTSIRTEKVGHLNIYSFITKRDHEVQLREFDFPLLIMKWQIFIFCSTSFFNPNVLPIVEEILPRRMIPPPHDLRPVVMRWSRGFLWPATPRPIMRTNWHRPTHKNMPQPLTWTWPDLLPPFLKTFLWFSKPYHYSALPLLSDLEKSFGLIWWSCSHHLGKRSSCTAGDKVRTGQAKLGAEIELGYLIF